MVKVRTLVPLTHPTTGEQFAAGVEVDVADEVSADWRADGKVAVVEDEKKAEGHYSARTTREDAASTKVDDTPKKGKG